MKRITTARQFGEIMGALGGCLEQKHYELLIAMAWDLVPFDKRRAGVLLPAHPYRPRDVEMPPLASRRRTPRSPARARGRR